MADSYPKFRSHYFPRSSAGRWAVGLFLALFAFTQPPLVFLLANRVEPRVQGMPFLYWYLFLLYVAAIGVLIWARKKGL